MVGEMALAILVLVREHAVWNLKWGKSGWWLSGSDLGVQGRLLLDEITAFNGVGIRQLASRRLAGVDHEKAAHATPKHSVDKHLAALNTKDCTCARVGGVAFGAGPVAKDDNDFLLLVGADQRLKPLDPVNQRLEVRLLGSTVERLGILVSLPRHGHDHHVGLRLEDVEAKLEGVPGGFEFVGAGGKC